MDERVKRVADFLQKHSIKSLIIEFDASTKNSQLAAQALNCTVAEIAKSIVFTAHEPVVVILSGDKRVDTERLSNVLGSPASLADAETVLRATGYAIGGVPPFAHSQPLQVLLDRSLERFGEVYAAAGAPNAVFKIGLVDLKKTIGGTIVDIST